MLETPDKVVAVRAPGRVQKRVDDKLVAVMCLDLRPRETVCDVFRGPREGSVEAARLFLGTAASQHIVGGLL